MTVASALKLIERERKAYVRDAKCLRESFGEDDHTAACYDEFVDALQKIDRELRSGRTVNRGKR